MNENELNPAQENSSVEPEAAKTAARSRTPGEIAFAVVAVVLIVAIMVALVVMGLDGSADSGETQPSGESTVQGTVPPDGNHDDVTCKGTYTVSDERAAEEAAVVVATMGDRELTNAELQIYYWMQVVSFLNEYGSYASMLGLDYTQPLDTQVSMMEDGLTWQQYFLDCALDAWHAYESLAEEAIAAGFDQESEDYKTYAASVREEVQASAKSYGFASIDEMLQSMVGAGSTEDAYIEYMQTYYLGYLYFNTLFDQMTPTAEEIEAYFDSNADAYAEAGIAKDDSIYVDVRHILIMPEGGTTDDSGNTTYSDEEWEAARVEAQGLLDQWVQGDSTEAAFGELANSHSDDSDGTDGGLYTYVAEGDMVTEFNDWCFDPARQVGDFGLVKTVYGYHVMYFSGSHPVWYANAESDLLNEISGSIVPDAMAKYETTFDYTSMVLGYVDLAG